MSNYDSPLIKVVIGPALPTWLASKPALNQWINVPNSQIYDGPSLTNFPNEIWEKAGLVKAGELMSAPGVGTSISAWIHMWAYSGLWFRRANAEIGQAASGGGGCWNGNDITSLVILSETPAWTVKVQPSNVAHLHPQRIPPPNPYMRDGRPNTMHTYYATQFNDINDRLVILGNKNAWETDNGWFGNVHRWQYGAADYSPAGTETPLAPSGGLGYDSTPKQTDPTTGDAYMMWNTILEKRTPAGVVTTVRNYNPLPGYLSGVQITQGSCCFWRRSNGQFGLFGISGNFGADARFWCFEISNGGVWHPLTSVTGVTAMLANPKFRPEAVPLCFDPVAEEFAFWNDFDARMYRANWNFSSALAVSDMGIGTLYTTAPQIGPEDREPYGNRLFWMSQANALVLAVRPTEPIRVIRRH